MKNKVFLKKSFTSIVLSFSFILPTYASSPTLNFISPHHTAINYMGRIDTSTQDYIDLWWPGSTIETNFTSL